MLSARALFLERMHALDRSVAIDAVTNRGLAEHEHNNVAKMLRNGLAVVGFAALEDFLKSRSSEALAEVGRTGVPFHELPEKLRNAATFEAISALSYQLSIRPKTDRTAYIQEQSLKLASTANSAYELTPHAFGYDQANLQEDSIKQMLKSFMIDDPWDQMTRLASRLGLVALPLEETFKNASRRRHRAAHVAHADTPQSDISQFVREALAIAFGFDSLVSSALDRLRARDRAYLSGRAPISAGSVKLRSVKNERGVWKEYVEGRTTAVKVEREEVRLVGPAKLRAAANRNVFVRFNSVGSVVEWECN